MKPSLKILQICHNHQGPFLDVTQFYARALQAKGQSVQTVFLKGKPIDSDAIFLQSSTKKLRGLKLGLFFKLKNIIKQQKPSVIIAHRFKSIYLATWATLFSKTPIIGVIHAHDVFKRPYRRLFARLFAKRLQILTVSKGIADNIRRDLGDCLPIHTLYNCIDVPAIQEEQVTRNAARKNLGLTDDDFIFGCVGRIHSDKDPITLTRAFAQIAEHMPNAKLVFIGKGKQENAVRDLVETLNLQEKVLMLGQVSQAYKQFKAFDVFVLASRLEPFGMVFLEAMAANVPIITSKTDGGIEVVKYEAQLFPIEDIQACAEKLLAAYHWNNEERENITQQAAQRLEQYFSQNTFDEQLWRHLEPLRNR